MAYNYKFTPLAEQDINEALDYISMSLSNSAASGDLFDAIAREIETICECPYGCPDCSHYLIDDEDIRHTVIGNYILVYEVSKAERLIKFLRFLYAGRDISNMGIT